MCTIINKIKKKGDKMKVRIKIEISKKEVFAMLKLAKPFMKKRQWSKGVEEAEKEFDKLQFIENGVNDGPIDGRQVIYKNDDTLHVRQDIEANPDFVADVCESIYKTIKPFGKIVKVAMPLLHKANLRAGKESKKLKAKYWSKQEDEA